MWTDDNGTEISGRAGTLDEGEQLFVEQLVALLCAYPGQWRPGRLPQMMRVAQTAVAELKATDATRTRGEVDDVYGIDRDHRRNWPARVSCVDVIDMLVEILDQAGGALPSKVAMSKLKLDVEQWMDLVDLAQQHGMVRRANGHLHLVSRRFEPRNRAERVALSRRALEEASRTVNQEVAQEDSPAPSAHSHILATYDIPEERFEAVKRLIHEAMKQILEAEECASRAKDPENLSRLTLAYFLRAFALEPKS